MRKSGTFRRLTATAQPRNRAGNTVAKNQPPSGAAFSSATIAANPEPPPAIRFPLPRIGRPLPATSFPVPRPGQFCPQFESVRRVFERLCRQFFRLCPQFARSCRKSAACRDLQSSAAELFIRSYRKKAQNAQENPSPVLSDTLSIRWERDGVRGFLTINHQLQSINEHEQPPPALPHHHPHLQRQPHCCRRPEISGRRRPAARQLSHRHRRLARQNPRRRQRPED